jgi:nucleotide-binding universal stress UspA family protein
VITIAHVLETFSLNIPYPELNPVTETTSEVSQAVENKLLQFSEEVQASSGCQVKTRVYGDAKISTTIIKAAKETNADLIIMGTHGAKGFEEFFVGSNTYRVVTDCPCPVLSVQKHAKTTNYKHILLPLDESFHSLEKVQYAALIAKSFNATIHIIGLNEEGDSENRAKVHLKVEKTKKYLADHGIASDAVFAEGANYAKLVFDHQEKINADLTVIMTEQNPDVSGLFLGPFAQQVVNHSRIPVLSIRPTYGYIEFPDLRGGFHAV